MSLWDNHFYAGKRGRGEGEREMERERQADRHIAYLPPVNRHIGRQRGRDRQRKRNCILMSCQQTPEHRERDRQTETERQTEK